MSTLRRQVTANDNIIGRKRKRSVSSKRTTVPRSLAPGSSGNSAIIPLTVDYAFDLTADLQKAFAWDTLQIYNNGVGQSIPGAAEVATVFSMMRVHKVEITIVPAATGLDYSAQTLSTGATNIPYVYEGVDYDDGASPSLSELQQNPTCKAHSFNRLIKRTVYPRLEGSNGIIDVGVNRRNIFMKSGATSTQRWQGWKIFMDMNTQVWTYGTGRIVFKIFYECKQSK